MRTLTDHIIPGDTNNKLTVTVLDEPGQGGACHKYHITGHGQHPNDMVEEGFPTQFVDCKINFQNGPIKEVGVNGITEVSLLTVLIDRLRCFQAGPFASEDNAQALIQLENALEHLHRRTKNRLACGVEGTNQK